MNLRNNPRLRDALASEYVLGTLSRRARARFGSLLRYDPALRQLVAEWERKLLPLAAAGAAIEPHPRVWRGILARIGGRGTRQGSLSWWRAFAMAGSSLALMLALFLALRPVPEPPPAMVAVMTDERAQPTMVVSWPSAEVMARSAQLRVRIVQDHPTMAANTSWELWLLPGGKGAPVSLGLVGLETHQTLRLKPEQVDMMGKAWGVALSVEPAGGSPTGAPTGPVIFKGQCVKII